MAGIMHKIEDTLNTGGKKDERKGETQGGYNQQEHRGGAQGERGFGDQIKDKLPGGGGGVRKGETQGGYNQQEHRGDAQGERKEGFVDKIKGKIPGAGGGSGIRGEGGEKKK
ncbi:hypothetical protein NC652_031146 [Populus alba x Populus x berolinensis]|nr:hypothetical protein NC652_031146 [Populus alba x Populus x berolinensis]